MDRRSRLRCSSETEDGYENSAIFIYLFFIRKNRHFHVGKSCENNLEIPTHKWYKSRNNRKGTGIILLVHTEKKFQIMIHIHC